MQPLPTQIFTTQTSAFIVLLTLTSLSGVPLSLLLFPLLLLRLGWLLLPVRRLRITSTWTLSTALEETLFLLFARPSMSGGLHLPSTPLFSIVDRCTVRNGLPLKIARIQLLQQLSVTLWHYNARVILCQYALSPQRMI